MNRTTMRDKSLQFCPLPLRSPDRLAHYKALADRSNEMMRKHGTLDRLGAADWRQERYQKLNSTNAGAWEWTKTARSSTAYYVDKWPSGWRQTGNASQILQDAGYSRGDCSCDWCADPEGFNVIVSCVLQMPARDGVPQYVPAWYSTEDCGVTLYPLDRHAEAKDAALAAAGYAERVAETEREYQEKEQARQTVAEHLDNIKTARAEHTAIVREMRAAMRAQLALIPGGEPAPATIDGQNRPRQSAICRALRAHLHTLRDAVADSRKRIKEMSDSFGDDVLIPE